jgi:hypothetical protein
MGLDRQAVYMPHIGPRCPHGDHSCSHRLRDLTHALTGMEQLRRPGSVPAAVLGLQADPQSVAAAEHGRVDPSPADPIELAFTRLGDAVPGPIAVTYECLVAALSKTHVLQQIG